MFKITALLTVYLYTATLPFTAKASAPNWQSFAILDYPYNSCDQNDEHACMGLGYCDSQGQCVCNVGW